MHIVLFSLVKEKVFCALAAQRNAGTKPIAHRNIALPRFVLSQAYFLFFFNSPRH